MSDTQSPCGCLVRFLTAPQNPTGCPWIAQAMVNWAGQEADGTVCDTPCSRTLRTVIVAQRARALRRPFMHEWNKAYRP